MKPEWRQHSDLVATRSFISCGDVIRMKNKHHMQSLGPCGWRSHDKTVVKTNYGVTTSALEAEDLVTDPHGMFYALEQEKDSLKDRTAQQQKPPSFTEMVLFSVAEDRAFPPWRESVLRQATGDCGAQ